MKPVVPSAARSASSSALTVAGASPLPPIGAADAAGAAAVAAVTPSTTASIAATARTVTATDRAPAGGGPVRPGGWIIVLLTVVTGGSRLPAMLGAPMTR
ncbi:hypothetical protein [Micromonospora sp. LOL_015]|uniref:hypothetical protein n=1 Tax=Micromonospora sp. LOL_015 TaxID=3345416 RepID=UPI003A8921CC